MDRLTSLLSRFELHARVFHTGPLCHNVWFDAANQVGYIHLLREGVLDLETQDEGVRRIDTPSMIFYPSPTGHRLIPTRQEGCDLVCATIDFGARLHNPVMMSLPGVVIVPFTKLAELELSLTLLFNEVSRPRCGQQALLDRLSEVVVIQVLRYLIDEGLVRDGVLAGLADKRLVQAFNAIHEDPARSWSLADLAQCSGMSRARFAAHFKKIVGQTPADYLLRWRLSVAKTLLKQGKPIKLIANQVGYANPSALTRAFSAANGITPLAWLAQANGGLVEG